jgi:N-acetylglucosaminyldiphosphoundecaprenol N-acetyl-beta-D-mannosaminyltransferase
MQKENSNLVGEAFEGSPSEEDAPNIIKKINDSGARLLLVAYGSPAQDFWINQHLLNLTSVRVAMGIGGTFDFLSGSIKRAPKWMQSSGLEWVWRLLMQPSRIGRIYTAVIRFPLLVFRG